VTTAPYTKSPKSKQYRFVNGTRYDDKALLIADDALASRGKIGLSDARAVFESVLDGPGVTKTELDTLAFVANGGEGGNSFHVVQSARTFLLEKVAAEATARGTRRNANDAGEETAAATTLKTRKAPSTVARGHAVTSAKKQKTETGAQTKTTPRTEIRQRGKRKQRNESETPVASKRVRSSEPAKPAVTTTEKKKRLTKGVVYGGNRQEVSPGQAATTGGARTENKVRFAASVSPSRENEHEHEEKTENENENETERSPLFAASPPPASPNTWLRRRDSSEASPSPMPSRGVARDTSHLGGSPTGAGTGTTTEARTETSEEEGDADADGANDEDEEEEEEETPGNAPAWFRGGQSGNDVPVAKRTSAVRLFSQEFVSGRVFGALRSPVSAPSALAAVGGAFLVGCVYRLGFGGNTNGGNGDDDDSNEWGLLAENWVTVELAVRGLAETLNERR
jgi:hypothetical protein